eukprot:2962499-Alexandrium_andersonii.AAC.1
MSTLGYAANCPYSEHAVHECVCHCIHVDADGDDGVALVAVRHNRVLCVGSRERIGVHHFSQPELLPW